MTRCSVALCTCLALTASCVRGARPERPRAEPEEAIRATAEILRDQALAGSRARDWVRGLTDEVGPRLAGSPGDARAITWAVATLKAQGFTNVRAETVRVRAWERGAESGEVISPYPQTLALTALGNSVPTPRSGIEAEVVEAGSLAALDALVDRGTSIQGKIVFFNQRMRRAADYGPVGGIRLYGASRAAKHGAAGVLIRSLSTKQARLPHTGVVLYDPAQPRIPAAALSLPDADLLERFLRGGGAVRVRLALASRTREDVESANVVGEIRGRERPQEIVLLGAHLDSWDLGTGALDDAAGCGIVIEAARLIGQLRVPPRRTLRVVLFSNEENGLAGGTGYVKAHQAELPSHVAALEADLGTGRPLGFTWHAGAGAESILRELIRPLEPLEATKLSKDTSGGVDISRLRPAGVPLFGLSQDATHYFDYHHSAEDTFDKIDPQSLDQAVAAVAVLAYGLAEIPRALPRPEP